MSNQGYYDHPEGDQSYASNNPWASSTGQNQQPSYVQGQPQQQQDFTAPTGPPPGQPPQRSDTFREADFVPESERGEQREAIQQFEINKTGENQHDKDVAQLQQEFPSIDGSLIAALYSDNGNLGATREMLQELASGTQ